MMVQAERWVCVFVTLYLVTAVKSSLGAAAPLDAATIPKFEESLVIPPVLAPTEQSEPYDRYHVAVRQFDQQVLPRGYPMTTVWGYGRAGDPLPGSSEPSSFHWPALTIETRTNRTVQVTWVNQLVDDPDNANPSFLPHLLPLDQTLHWANPPGPRDMRGFDAQPYLGPVPIVTHVHGAHVPSISDGLPEQWFLPNAGNIPPGYATEGTYYGTTQPAEPGSAVFEYPNDQRATTLWYHDHALGMTRLNVYAGLAGFWIVRDDVEDSLGLPGPAPRLGDAEGTRYYEIPLAIQDRSFAEDGSLWYPDTRAYFDGFEGPYSTDAHGEDDDHSDVSPVWNPEFFGATICVNGRTWPYLEAEPRLYRFRILNGCNSRFLVLEFDQPLSFAQIGSEGGLLPGAPHVQDQLVIAPAERFDVIVDFSSFSPGDEIILLNRGPDAPFGGLPIAAEELADPATTGQVMQFRVIPLSEQGSPGQIPTELPPIEVLGETDAFVRDLTLNEEMSILGDLPVAALLGTAEHGGLPWGAPITETPLQGDTEIWRFINLTEDAHPVHLHLVMFQVLDRTAFDAEAYKEAQERYWEGERAGPPDPMEFVMGPPEAPAPWESGWKDTVIAPPGVVTRIIAMFDLPGTYVWHCHILEHEDNEMMRPYEVLPAAP